MRKALPLIFCLLTCCMTMARAEASIAQKDNHPTASHTYSPKLTAQNDFPFSQGQQQTDFLIVAKEMVVQAVVISASYTADYLIGELEQRQPNHSLTDFCSEQGQLLFLRILFQQIIAPNAP